MTLFAGLAAAQVGGGSQLLCANIVGATPMLRGEGYSELTGDITITCTGGLAPALGAVIPAVNIQVFYNSAVTSRLLPVAGVSSSISEALLIIDEPGSGLPAAVPGFGSAAGQNLCPTPLQSCVQYVSQAAGSSIPVATDTPQGTSATTPGRNVFQGLVASGNSVTFFGIPVLAPNTLTRTFRITNVRINATPFNQGAGALSPVQASISISGSTSLLLSDPQPYVGFITRSLDTQASLAPSVSQCTSQTLAPTGTLSFAEGFGAAFKTRVAAQDNILYAGQNGTPGLNGFAAQNVPGSIYNAESNLVLPVATGQTAGLADFGTRLKAVFNNVPAGVRLFVSVSNVLNTGLPAPIPAVPGGSTANAGTNGFAQLTADEAAAFSAVAATDSAPGNVPVAEVPVSNGSAVAVWEIINTNPDTTENLQFAVYASYTANPAQNSPSPGTTTVHLSYAPSPPNFPSGNGADASDTLPVPRFLPDVDAARNLLTVLLGSCSPILSASISSSGYFTQGQIGATYMLTVANAPAAAATNETVTVVDTLPAGLTATAISGPSWSCTPGTLTCTRSDALAAGSSYPPISVTVNVAANAGSPLVNRVTVSGGGAAAATASNSTIVIGTVSSDLLAPSADSGFSQTFLARYSDTAGSAAIATASVAFAGGSDPRVNSCFVTYDRVTNTLNLLTDAGVQGPAGIPGATGTLENSACLVNLRDSSLQPDANTLTLILAMTFKPQYAGAKSILISAQDTAMNVSAPIAGTWTVPAAAAVVTADNVSPSSGVGASQKFTLQYTDSHGSLNLQTASVLFNATFADNPANSCMLTYDRAAGTLSLLNDAGTQGQSGTPGTGTLQNSQCYVDLALSSAAFTGNVLVLKLAMIFRPAFAGAKNVYMFGVDGGGINSGWQTRGTWTATLDSGAAFTITCPSQVTTGSEIACSLAFPYSGPTQVDNLAFKVAVAPNGAAPALTTGQLGFSSRYTGAVTDTAGSANSISVAWTNVSPPNFLYIGGYSTPLGSLGFVIPASATPGQSYSVTISGANASMGGIPVSLSIGLPVTISIPAPGQPSCTTNVSVTPTVRAEGYSEGTGDIVLLCTGGTVPALGAAIPQTNITITLNTAATSRLLPPAGIPNGISEALLLIDEPGSGLPTLVPNFGPAAPLNLCATLLQGCVEFVSQKAGINVATDVPQGTAATTPGRNVFQGVVNGNSVTFYGVPVLPPDASFSRVFRITNLRANASALGGGGPMSFGEPVLASISTSGSTTLGFSNTSTSTVAFVAPGVSSSAAGAATLNQCNSQDLAPVTTLAFSENFGTALKTRVAAFDNTPYSGQGAGSYQSIPGMIYNSESNFVMQTAIGKTAGLSDFGTRLKAQFNNVPPGVRLFVSVTNVLNSGMPVPVPAVIGGYSANTGTNGFAQLTASDTGPFSAVAATSFGNSGSVPVAEIPVINGSGAAIWEVININPNAIETLRFAVFTSYTPDPAQNMPPPGVATINLSFAPGPPAFSASAAANASDVLPVPRFIPDVNAAASILTVSAGSCLASLSIAVTHQGSFAQAQSGAAYSVTVANAPSASPTTGTVTVTETVPAGLTLVSMSGTGWTCPGTAANNCTRSDTLAAGASYPPITVTVNVSGECAGAGQQPGKC